jgi:hypothetical protein
MKTDRAREMRNEKLKRGMRKGRQNIECPILNVELKTEARNIIFVILLQIPIPL